MTDPNLVRTYMPTEVLNTNNWHTGSGYYKLGALKWYSELEYNPFTKELKILNRIGNVGNVDLSNISQNENILKIMQNFIQTDKAYYYITSEYINEEECNKYVDVKCEFSFKAIKNDQMSTSNEMARQQTMMTNIFTIMIIVMSVFMTTALDIYWMTTNLFTIGQNLLVRRRVKK